MTVTWKRRYAATLAAIVAAATGLALSFVLLSDSLGEVAASRVGAAIAVVAGLWLAGTISKERSLWLVAGLAVMAVLGALAAAVTAALDGTGEFLSLGLGTAWMAGVAVAVHADRPIHRLGRLFLVGLAGPLLLIGGAVGFAFAGIGAVPAVGALAALVPLGDLVSTVVADAGGGVDETVGSGRVGRPREKK